jgi:hypothetical protein
VGANPVTVSQGSRGDNAQEANRMQAVFSQHEQRVKAFRGSVSEPRFARYLTAANQLELNAIYLYDWNCRLAQSLYFPMHMWEIVLRNKLNAFFCARYTPAWPYSPQFVRNLTDMDGRRLKKAIEKQERDRHVSPVPTGCVVAELTAGFWVSQLSRAYDLPHVWRTNLLRIFPNESNISRLTANNVCSDLLDVRNRIAHHEPIFLMPLEEIRVGLDRMLAGMCETSHQYAKAACTFNAVFDVGPATA